MKDEAAVVEGVGEEDVVFEDGGLGDEAAVGVERLLGFGGEPVGVGDAEKGVGDAELVVEGFADGEGFGEQGEGSVGVAEAGPTVGDVVEDDAFIEAVALFTVDFEHLLVFDDGFFVAGLGGEGGGAFGEDGGIVLGQESDRESEEKKPHVDRVYDEKRCPAAFPFCCCSWCCCWHRWRTRGVEPCALRPRFRPAARTDCSRPTICRWPRPWCR